VQKIYLKCPKKMQVMMFSATMSDEMRLIARKFMKNVRTSPPHRTLGHYVEVTCCVGSQCGSQCASHLVVAACS
jgi:superfamily II DNA/RNA helicase